MLVQGQTLVILKAAVVEIIAFDEIPWGYLIRCEDIIQNMKNEVFESLSATRY